MYLDTAILVKLFTPEPDSNFFVKLTDGEIISSSVLASTELWSALLAKERAGILTLPERRRAWSVFEQNVEEETIELAAFNPAIFKKANRIMEQCHPQVALRTLDALHLATCDQLQDWPMGTTDARMRQAAELLRFPLTEMPGQK